MLIENVMGDPLTDEEMEIQVCIEKDVNGTFTRNQDLHGALEPMNHSTFIYFATGYMFFMTLLFGLFFNTKLKRTMADQGELDLEDVLNSDELNENKRDNSKPNDECEPENKRESKMVGIELSDIKTSLKAAKG